jgi:hypothetical protein
MASRRPSIFFIIITSVQSVVSGEGVRPGVRFLECVNWQLHAKMCGSSPQRVVSHLPNIATLQGLPGDGCDHAGACKRQQNNPWGVANSTCKKNKNK